MPKKLITEQQFDRLMYGLLTENKLHDKAIQIVKTYYPQLIDKSATGIQILTDEDVIRIVNELNRTQSYSTHALNWLLEIIVQNPRMKVQIMEDLDIYASYLRKFDENKAKIIANGNNPELWSLQGQKKVLNYKNKTDLYDAILPFFKSKNIPGDLIYPKVKQYVEMGAFDLVGETNTWYVVKLKRGFEDAVIDIQRGPNPAIDKTYTTWCTRTGGTWLNHYMSESPLFMLINKQTAKTTNRSLEPESMLQFYWGKPNQFKNRDDVEINLPVFWNEYPDVYEIFYSGLIDIIMDGELTPWFSHNTDLKKQLPKELLALYKQKHITRITPVMANKLKVKEQKINLYDYTMNGIYADVFLPTKRQDKDNVTYLITTINVYNKIIQGVFNFEFFSELTTITGLLSGYPSNWFRYIDSNSLQTELQRFSNMTKKTIDEEMLFDFRRSLIKNDYNTQKAMSDPSLNKYDKSDWLGLLGPMRIVNRESVMEAISDPNNAGNFSLHILPMPEVIVDEINLPYKELLGRTKDSILKYSEKRSLVGISIRK